MFDRTKKSGVVHEDKKLVSLTNNVQLASGIIFQVLSLADEYGCKRALKHVKRLLAFGHLQFALNQGRRKLSYGEIYNDHSQAKDHVKEASDSFAKVANWVKRTCLV